MRQEEPGLYGFEDRFQNVDDFVGYDFYRWSIKPKLNDIAAQALTDNKWVFFHVARGLGLPVPDTLALFDPDFGISTDGVPCRTAEQLVALLDAKKPSGFVIKPAGGIQGEGLIIFENIDYSTGQGSVRGGGDVDVASELKVLPPINYRSSRGYVIQKLVPQHPLLMELGPWTTNTVRVVTHLTRSGEVLTPFTLLRLGRQGNAADNWEQGGIAVGIESATGRLASGLFKPKHGGQWVSTHPDSGVTFVGRTLPRWNDVLRLVRRAAASFPGVRSIGWDVVIGSDGPVILEANEEWDLVMAQAVGGGWLSIPGIRDDFEHYGIHCPPQGWWRPIVTKKAVSRRLLQSHERTKRRATGIIKRRSQLGP